MVKRNRVRNASGVHPIAPPSRHLPAVVVALCSVCSAALALPRPPVTDRHGDPLPPGAVARLGTARLRAVCESIHFSADGKTLIGVDGRLIRIWDAADGSLRDVRRLPGDDAKFMARSADGSTLFLTGDSRTELWDLPSGKRLDLRALKVNERSV